MEGERRKRNRVEEKESVQKERGTRENEIQKENFF